MKNSFVVYTDYLEHMELLSMEQRGLLFTIMLCYVSGKDLPNADAATTMAFSFIKARIDRDIETYEHRIEARRSAGRKGGIAKSSNSKQNVANCSNAKQVIANVADNVNDNVNDNDNDNDKESKRKHFVPPTLDDVMGYCREKGYTVDAERFIDFYESKGWMVGKNKMKDWKAAIRNWARQEKGTSSPVTGKKNAFHNFNERDDYDFDKLEADLLKGDDADG